MEDRFLSRGKRIDNGEWVEGLITKMWGQLHIINPDNENTAYPIDEDSICQCTGYEGIYEKDIFQCDDERYVIEWCDYSLGWEAQAIGSVESISLGEFSPKEIDVIGNEIDNPELLK